MESFVPRKEHWTDIENFHGRPEDHHPVVKNHAPTNSKELARVENAHPTPHEPKAATLHAVPFAPHRSTSGVIRHRNMHFSLQASVTGEHPSALISADGAVKAVSVGDSVDGMLVSAIQENQITFSDGTTLHLRGKRK
ncbi:MAG: hypothetical protein M3Z14_06255 [Candidatus Eremiobacteraeota bacterium]|nr:hypothetical protein [Candidatus Eremiobacteraeota bacterium]